MTPYHADDWLTVYLGDCRAVMAAMEPESVQTVITSPPYWGLRDYGTATWEDGDPDCAHSVGGQVAQSKHPAEGHATGQRPGVDASWCRKCGARRVDDQIGLEASPDAFVEALVEVFREVRRVLRADGTVWLNLGDSYANDGKWGGSTGGKHVKELHGTVYREPPEREVTQEVVDHLREGGATRELVDYAERHVERGLGRGKRQTGLKPKDRVMIPARVALALQADGWWLRDEIVWHKPNPMPSSVRDRTTPAHEMVYLLTKSARYHYDAAAIAEPAVSKREELLRFEGRPELGYPGHSPDRRRNGARVKVPGGWDIEPGGHNGIHRNGRTEATYRDKTAVDPRIGGQTRNKRSVWTIATQPYPEAHYATFPEALVEPMILAGCPEGGVVMDPFAGSGTTALVANRLGRRAVLIDLSGEYLDQAIKRIGKARAGGDGPSVDVPVPFAADGLWGAS